MLGAGERGVAGRGDLAIDIGGGDDASHAPISRCRSGRLERTGIIVRRGGAGDSSRGGFRVARMMFSATQRASRHTHHSGCRHSGCCRRHSRGSKNVPDQMPRLAASAACCSER
jgi:hypothetical protein